MVLENEKKNVYKTGIILLTNFYCNSTSLQKEKKMFNSTTLLTKIIFEWF